MSDAHDHDHAHDAPGDEMSSRVAALEATLIAKGYVDPEALDAIVETYESKVGPRNGARAVARAWKDADFRRRLLADASEAMASMGFEGRQGEHMVAIENTRSTHNLVVCTLCSCYPWPALGLPPRWYKSAPYRARAVSDPTGVLADFGVSLLEGQRVRVWDSTAEIRYLVLPMPPSDIDRLDEESASERVTRDSMIGVGLALESSGRGR